jgi:hypothetical protein
MARWKREFTAGKRMADKSRELRHKGANSVHHSDGGEPRRRKTPIRCTAYRLLESVCREIVAALAGRFGSAFPGSVSRVGLCAGKQGNLTSILLALVLPLRSLEPSHATMRRIFIARVARFSHLCVLIIQSCRPRSIRTMPAKHFNSVFSVAGQPWIGSAILNRSANLRRSNFLRHHPELSGRDSQVRVRQLTNRRILTFIATPSARNVNSTEDPP